MTVYVDEFRRWAPTKIRCFMKGSAHLTADALDELHAFAKKLGMQRAWFQEHKLAPHYDLTESRRNTALALGAKFVPALEQARIRQAKRKEAKP